jgi:LysM repeat protein
MFGTFFRGWHSRPSATRGNLEEEPVSSISITPAGFATALSAPRPLRITRRGRVVLGALVAAPIVAGLLMASVSGPAAAGNESGSVTFSTVTVSAGESLWTIAQRIAPESDPREVIGELERFNGLEGSAVLPGQTLSIPSQYAH